MKQLFNKLFSFFNTIKSNIAFYPTILAAVGFALSLIMVVIEKQGISNYLFEVLPQLVVEDGDTALTVLSVCIGGLISMMVFSFSMVMLLLSQASSNFSPRLLPGLISDKRHQIILGVYLATILYCIFTMFTIEPSEDKYSLPGFSILLAIIFTIMCLGSFIYFIHNISESIQISNIVDTIYKEARERLADILEKEEQFASVKTFHDTSNWHSYKTEGCGYFQNLSYSNIIDFCKKHDTKLSIEIPKGLFVLDNMVFFKSEKELDKEQLESFFSNINFSKSELVTDNYALAFKQLTEIAVKAMSPGINDPGTAINAIDYLTELFALRMKKKDVEIFVKDETSYFRLETIKFRTLLYNVMASLRTYCKHDPTVVQKLLWMLTYLLEQPVFEKDYKSCVENEMQLLKKDSKTIIEELGLND
ncbi:DUF2254 domain-containing protein [Subsaxibacter sp. CAU 1640]|uniref:DUF2254 domain-containing protein n=1 Tax=Subsaxibacter sp. CAU 1640 TaxID=2933271 RepID=UPI0020048F39|nr:DUF2254 domain-containing protein [Subsaxibacter sp. CAU 1640]MCK7589862.1 DUF2254 domain-containing protein [Subsaxibacter sp. CAU 1640]